MNQSLFTQYVEKYFKSIIGKITETINGKKKEEQLLHKTMLKEEHSVDLNYGATNLLSTYASADVVTMDSSLPLKKRDKVTSATGGIPKIGIKFRKGEKDISDINIMMARGASEAIIAGKLFDDAVKVVKGIDIAKEIMFQQGLSTGVALAPGANADTGVRISYGYKDENTFKPLLPWGQTGYTPCDDIQKMFDKAEDDGNSISIVMLSKKYFDFARKSEQGKLLAAHYQGQIIVDKMALPIPLRTIFLEALADEFGAEFRIVNSSFKVEDVRGNQTSVKPWATANLVGLPDEVVGRLVYGTLAEETNPVSGVVYQKAGSHILVAKYSKTDPLQEFTSAQAIVVPVIDGVESIYLLQADEVEAPAPQRASAPTSTDDVTVGGSNFPKAGVIAALNSVGVTTTGNTGVVKVTEKVEALTEEQLTELLHFLNS